MVNVENVLNSAIAYCEKRAAGAKKFRALRLNGQIIVFTKLAEMMFNCALCVCPRFYFVDLTWKPRLFAKGLGARVYLGAGRFLPLIMYSLFKESRLENRRTSNLGFD